MEKIALVTGVTSGFGQLIADHICKKGYRLIVLARSPEKGEALQHALLAKYPKTEIEVISCDLSSLNAVKKACEQVKEKYSRIDLLVLNAGIMNFEFRESADGIEETFQVNLLAPFLITFLLKERIPVHQGAKILFTASGLHQGTIQWQDPEFRKRFSSFRSYRHSKLGVILLTRLLAVSEDFKGIFVACVHPGMVRTELGKNAGWFSRMIFKMMGSSLEKGAETHGYLIDANPEHLVSGEYYSNKKITKTAAPAYDLEQAGQLLQLVKTYLKDYLE